MNENNFRNQSDQADMKWNKGALQIRNVRYRKKVHTLNPERILSMDDEEIDKIMKIPIVSSKEIRKSGSTFIGYTVEVKTYEEIEKAYLKMKLLYADARHITCAFVLQGKDTFYCRDYCDDDEHGLGRQLLQLLSTNKIECRAVFVIRYYEKKIGPDRYTLAKKVATEAINNAPINKYVNMIQKVELEKSENTTAASPTYSAIARGTRGGRTIRSRGARGGYNRGMASRVYKPATPVQIKSFQESQLKEMHSSLDSVSSCRFEFSEPRTSGKVGKWPVSSGPTERWDDTEPQHQQSTENLDASSEVLATSQTHSDVDN